MLALDSRRESRIARIDLLEIDAEGFESYILAGGAAMLRSGRVGIALLENNGPVSWQRR